MRPSHSIAVVGVLLSAGCLAEEPTFEVFADRGDVFMRAGANAGLTVGVAVVILGDPIPTTHERRHVGTATVMEVWPSLARLSLDEAAKADKTAKKFAAVEKRPPPLAPSPPPLPPTAMQPASGLVGHATFNGAGRWKLLILSNDEAKGWTRCALRLPGNLVYLLDSLAGGDHESIALSNFELKGPERDLPIDFVTVSCLQGSGTFVFPE